MTSTSVITCDGCSGGEAQFRYRYRLDSLEIQHVLCPSCLTRYWHLHRHYIQLGRCECEIAAADPETTVWRRVVGAGPVEEPTPEFVSSVVARVLTARRGTGGPLRRIWDRVVGFDPMIILLVVQLVMQVLKLWWSRRADPRNPNGSPELDATSGPAIVVDPFVFTAFEAELEDRAR